MVTRAGAISFLADWKSIEQHFEILFFSAQVLSCRGVGMREMVSHRMISSLIDYARSRNRAEGAVAIRLV